jgi:hypothetical protein
MDMQIEDRQLRSDNAAEVGQTLFIRQRCGCKNAIVDTASKAEPKIVHFYGDKFSPIKFNAP